MKTKIFTIRIKDDLKRKMAERANKSGWTLSHLIKRAIELQMIRDNNVEKNIAEGKNPSMQQDYYQKLDNF